MGITISVQACRQEDTGILEEEEEEVESRAFSAHLVEPADEAQAARRRLRRVQTRGASGVVVIDLCCLGDATQQMVVRYGATEGQILARHLGNVKRFKGHD